MICPYPISHQEIEQGQIGISELATLSSPCQH